MKQTLVIVVLAMLLVATIGTSAAVAVQQGRSPVYQFNVIKGDTVAGKLVVDTTVLTAATFVFNGKGFTAGETYYLCDASFNVVGSGVANNGGNVHMEGLFPTSIDVTKATFSVVTNSAPVADFDFTADGLTVTFTDKSTDADISITSWSWDFGDSTAASTEQNPSHTYAATGTYTVTLTVTDGAGATDSASASVKVTDLQMTIDAVKDPYSPTTYDLYAQVSGGTQPYTIQWYVQSPSGGRAIYGGDHIRCQWPNSYGNQVGFLVTDAAGDTKDVTWLGP